MTAFELDEELVRRAVRNVAGTYLAEAAKEMLQELEKQLPRELPKWIGTVVRLESGRIAVRADESLYCWRWFILGSPDGDSDWCDDESLPTIAEVLSPGVKL